MLRDPDTGTGGAGRGRGQIFNQGTERSHTIAELKRSQVPTTDSTGESEGGSMQFYV